MASQVPLVFYVNKKMWAEPHLNQCIKDENELSKNKHNWES